MSGMFFETQCRCTCKLSSNHTGKQCTFTLRTGIIQTQLTKASEKQRHAYLHSVPPRFSLYSLFLATQGRPVWAYYSGYRSLVEGLK